MIIRDLFCYVNMLVAVFVGERLLAEAALTVLGGV